MSQNFSVPQIASLARLGADARQLIAENSLDLLRSIELAHHSGVACAPQHSSGHDGRYTALRGEGVVQLVFGMLHFEVAGA